MKHREILRPFDMRSLLVCVNSRIIGGYPPKPPGQDVAKTLSVRSTNLEAWRQAS